MTDILVTRHASLRMGQRAGLRKKAISRQAERALKLGMGIEDTRGALRKYLIVLSLRTLEYGKDPKVLVHAGHVYIFTSTGALITTWPLPKKFGKGLKPYREIEGEEDETEAA